MRDARSCTYPGVTIADVRITPRLRRCAVAPSLSDPLIEFEYHLHWSELCMARGRGWYDARGGGLTAAACAVTNATDGVNNDTRSRCSAYARLTHVLEASFADSRRSECCNTLSRRAADGAPILSCAYGAAATSSLVSCGGLSDSV